MYNPLTTTIKKKLALPTKPQHWYTNVSFWSNFFQGLLVTKGTYIPPNVCVVFIYTIIINK